MSPIINLYYTCMLGYIHVEGSEFTSFLLCLYDYLSYVVCYAHVFLCTFHHNVYTVPGALTCKVQLSTAETPNSFSATHWYIPECFTAVKGMVRVSPEIILSLSPSSRSPLKYQVTVGSGLPSTEHWKSIGTPVNTSVSSPGEATMTAGSVGMEDMIHVREHVTQEVLT